MMKKFLIGKKIGMTQLMVEGGNVVPVTVVQLGPCQILDKKEKDKYGYQAVVLGYGKTDLEKLSKPKRGYFVKKNNEVGYKLLKEYRPETLDGLDVNSELTLDIFEKDEKVSVRSKTIGRGFTGTIKRHNFKRGPMSHGSKSHRIPGSIGAGTSPSHIFKGKRMAGHYGDEFVTIHNLSVVGKDLETSCIFLKGAIPGKKNNVVEVFVS
jgi:large subunit ribosomal protein L3